MPPYPDTSDDDIDTDVSRKIEMPSISRLLNRKKLGLGPPPPPQATRGIQKELLRRKTPVSEPQMSRRTPPKLPPKLDFDALSQRGKSKRAEVPPSLPEKPSAIPTAAQSPTHDLSSGAAQPRIQPASRKHRATQHEVLIQWHLTDLLASHDPLARGLSHLLKNGAYAAVFLSIQPPPGELKIPVFHATAAIGPTPYFRLWTGLRWNPETVSAFWKRILNSGYMILAPTESHTNPSSGKYLVRGAFGLAPDEWLTILQVGPMEACRGVLAVVSKVPLEGFLEEGSSLLRQAPAKRSAA